MTASPLIDRLRRQELILDGGTGTTLQAMGLPRGRLSSLWSVERPEQVRHLHEAYIKAGADIILTNTVGALGANLVGGRCGVSPSGLRTIALAVKGILQVLPVRDFPAVTSSIPPDANARFDRPAAFATFGHLLAGGVLWSNGQS